jgi:predicted permease
MKQNDTSNATEEVVWQQSRKLFNTPTVVLGCVSVLLNIFVIVTFMKIRKSKRKLPQAAIQLLILAAAEAAASLNWPLGLVYGLLRENAYFPRSISLLTVLHSYYGYFCCGISRHLTLYIAASRVYVMWSFRHAHQNLQKTEKDHIRETILFGILPSVVFLLILSCIGVTLSVTIDSTSGRVTEFIYFCIVVVLMVSLASYILWRIRHVDVELGQCTESSAAKVTLAYGIWHGLSKGVARRPQAACPAGNHP